MANEVSKKKEESNLTVAQYTDKMVANVLGELNKRKGTGLSLPKDYAPENAVMSAMFIISRTVDRSSNPVLQSCTGASIKEALLDMLYSGLNPQKKQCYFIPYGDKLTCMDSYFGVQAKAKRADPTIMHISATVVYEGDEFSYEIADANISNISHKQNPDNIDINKIKGAYATIVHNDDRRESEYMTIQQIHTSWSRGQTKGKSSAHEQNPEEMCKRTVTKRLVKATINSSSDAELFYDNEDIVESEELQEELEATEIISIPDEHEVEQETEEEEPQEAEPVKEVQKAKPEPKKEPGQANLFDL